MTGPVPHWEVPSLLASAAIGLAPYARDAPGYFSPLKLFEYLAAGLAVVAGGIPGVREIVNSEQAVLVPPGDAEALAAAVLELAGDEPRRAQLGAAGRTLVASRHTWDARARRILSRRAGAPRGRQGAVDRVSGGARLLVPYVRREWRALATVSGTTAVAAMADLARPLPLALVVNVLIAEAGGAPGFDLDAGHLWLLAGVAGLVLAIAVVEGLATYVAEIHLKRAGERITHDLRLETHAELQRLSLGYHARRPAGDLVTRVTSDVHAVGGIFSESLGAVLSSVLLLVGMLVVATVIDPVLALTAFATAPALALVSLRSRRRLKAAAQRQRAREGEIAALTTETLGAIREVKALGSEGLEHERLRAQERGAPRGRDRGVPDREPLRAHGRSRRRGRYGRRARGRGRARVGRGRLARGARRDGLVREATLAPAS